MAATSSYREDRGATRGDLSSTSDCRFLQRLLIAARIATAIRIAAIRSIAAANFLTTRRPMLNHSRTEQKRHVSPQDKHLFSNDLIIYPDTFNLPFGNILSPPFHSILVIFHGTVSCFSANIFPLRRTQLVRLENYFRVFVYPLRFPSNSSNFWSCKSKHVLNGNTAFLQLSTIFSTTVATPCSINSLDLCRNKWETWVTVLNTYRS